MNKVKLDGRIHLIISMGQKLFGVSDNVIKCLILNF